MTTPTNIPTEYEEQVALRQYCDLRGFNYFAVPNETFTKSWNQKRRNAAKGVVKGVPDFFVVVGDKLLAIELKRLKGGVVGAEQRFWIDRLNSVGVKARVCKGAAVAIQFIEEVEKS